jgi:Holliday junction resolvasome RuvABC endonuclease subunit
LVHSEYYKPPPTKKVSLFESLSQTKAYILDVVNNWSPDKVVIEDISEYMGNRSTSKTIIKLAVYNRTVGLAVFEEINEVPLLINVNTVRSILRPKGYKGRLAKEDVPDVVAAIMKIDFPYVFKKSGKVADESCDMADAMAVALAQAALDIQEDEENNES